MTKANFIFEKFKSKPKSLRFLLIGCLIFISIYLILFSFVANELLTNGLLFAVVFLLFWGALLPFAFISSIYFLRKGKNSIKVLLWFILNLAVFGITVLPLYDLVPRGFLFFAFPVSLIGTLLIFDSKDAFRKRYSNFLIVAMSICMPTLLAETLPYIYSPPVLTEKSVKTYNKAISFLLERDQLTSFTMSVRNGIFPEETLTNTDLELCRKILSQLLDVGCGRTERTDALVLFYKYGNCILPSGYGVAYSLNGVNPNDVDNEQVNKAKPFEYLTGNWYISHNMTFVGPRIDILVKMPKALIDRSRDIGGVSAEELHRFDKLSEKR